MRTCMHSPSSVAQVLLHGGEKVNFSIRPYPYAVFFLPGAANPGVVAQMLARAKAHWGKGVPSGSLTGA